MEEKEQHYNVGRDELIPYIKQAYQELLDWLRVQRKRLGGRYNWSNDYETIHRKFCSGQVYPDKWADEFLLIVDKSSKRPSSQRAIIKKVGLRALDLYIASFKEKKPVKNKIKPPTKL